MYGYIYIYCVIYILYRPQFDQSPVQDQIQISNPVPRLYPVPLLMIVANVSCLNIICSLFIVYFSSNFELSSVYTVTLNLDVCVYTGHNFGLFKVSTWLLNNTQTSKSIIMTDEYKHEKQ